MKELNIFDTKGSYSKAKSSMSENTYYIAVEELLAGKAEDEQILMPQEMIDRMTLESDKLFCLTMKDEFIATSIVREFLNDNEAKVLAITSHETYDFFSKRLNDIIQNELDIVVFTSKGEVVNIELQCRKDDRGPIVDRAILYGASCMLAHQENKGDSKYKINKTVVCFLCGYDWRENPEAHEVLHLISDNTGKRATENFEIHMICYRKYGELFDSAIKSLCAMLAGSPDDSSFTEYTEEVISMVKNSKEMHYMTAKEVREMYERDMQDSELRGEARGEIKGRVKLLESLRKELAKGVPLTEEVLRKYEEM